MAHSVNVRMGIDKFNEIKKLEQKLSKKHIELNTWIRQLDDVEFQDYANNTNE